MFIFITGFLAVRIFVAVIEKYASKWDPITSQLITLLGLMGFTLLMGKTSLYLHVATAIVIYSLTTEVTFFSMVLEIFWVSLGSEK